VRRVSNVATLALIGILAARSGAAQNLIVDTAGAGRLIDEAMNRSQVARNLQYLTDVIGPRLTGSPAARAANDWTMRKFQEYGLTARLEQWNFGGAWERGPMWMRMIAPRVHDVIAASWAWAPGTNGATVRGPVLRIDASLPESLAANLTKVQGAFVMLSPPAFVWNTDGPPMTAADSTMRREYFRALFAPFQSLDSEARERLQQFQIDVPYILKNAGALAVLLDGAKEQTLLTMSGSPNRVLPLPQIVVAHEEYAMFDRLLQAGIAPRLEASISNRMRLDSVPQWNTVAEIRGTDRPGQVVIVGAHLDSWELATGTSDNGTGSMTTLEAARIIAQSGLRPRRTIRFILFTGEEQGLIGSKKYAAAHAAEMDAIQAVIVLDNGVGAITGQALQGRPDLEGLWRQILAPVARLGADSVVNRNKGGTDHLSFLPYGVPSFNFNQLERGYGHTHHSQSDTYDKALEADLKQASAVMAVSAYALANLSDLIPRGPKEPQTPVAAQVPSDSVMHVRSR
jgi:carboxypeptidase Q